MRCWTSGTLEWCRNTRSRPEWTSIVTEEEQESTRTLTTSLVAELPELTFIIYSGNNCIPSSSSSSSCSSFISILLPPHRTAPHPKSQVNCHKLCYVAAQLRPQALRSAPVFLFVICYLFFYVLPHGRGRCSFFLSSFPLLFR